MATQTEALIIDIGTRNEEKVKSLKQSLREAREEAFKMMQQFGENSAQYNAAAKKLADINDKLGDMNRRVQALNPDRFERIARVGQGMIGGFQAVSGTLTLIGVQSEDWEKTMVRLQAAMSISQGLQQLKDYGGEIINAVKGIKDMTIVRKLDSAATAAAATVQKAFGVAVVETSTSFKVLKGAIAATGIGLLVVLIGEAVSALSELGDQADETGKKLDASMKFIEGVTKRNEDSMRIEIAQAKRRGASEEELFRIRGKYHNMNVDLINEERATAEDKQKYDELLKQKEVEAEELTTERTLYLSNKRKEAIQKETEAAQKAYEQRLQDAKEFQDTMESLIEEQNANDLKAEDDNIKLKEELQTHGFTARQKQVYDLARWYNEQNNKAGTDQVTLEKVYNQRLLDIKQQWADEDKKIQDAADEKEIAAKKAQEDKKLALEKKYRDAKKAMMNLEMQAAGELAGNLSQILGNQTAAGKAFALAQVGIDEGRALASALANANSVNPDNIVTGGIAGMVKFLTIAASITSTALKARNIIKSGSGGGNVNLNAPAQSSQSLTIGARVLSNGTQSGTSGSGYVPVLPVESLSGVQRRVVRSSEIGTMK